MAGLTDLGGKTALDWITGKATPAAVATRYLALLLGPTVGTDVGTGFTEVSGTSYARQDITTTAMGAATASAGVQSSTNSGGAVAFPNSGSDWTGAGTTPIVAFGVVNHISNAISGTTLLAWDYLGGFDWQPCTVTLASPGVFTAKAHGFSNNDIVVFSTEMGGTAPTTSAGVTTGLLYVANATTDTFTVLSGGTFNASSVLTSGTAVNMSSTGSGMIRKVAVQQVPFNTTLSVTSNNLPLKIG